MNFNYLTVRPRSFLVLFLLFVQYGLLAQTKKANVWCFGAKAGIEFNSPAPSAAGLFAIHSGETCSSVCDDFGNLLCYTSGDTVWDRTHIPMPAGTGLTGHNSSTQGSLIAPVIGTCDKYYVFCGVAAEHGLTPPGLRYSIIDMSLPGNGTLSCPLGDVIIPSKSTHLTTGALTDTLDEKLTSVMHANGTDYWIIVRERFSNTYYSFLVTAAGVNPVPVQSSTGLSGYALTGYLKPSKDGRQLIACNGMYFTVGPPTPGLVELIDFDNTTGILSNAVKINTGTDEIYYGASFSCNDSLIYIGTTSFSSGGNSILQYQRFAPVVSTTETVIATPALQGALQLGPDRKIYYFGVSAAISLINNPNSLAAPGFLPLAFPLLPGALSNIGSPNIFHGYEREFCNSPSSGGGGGTNSSAVVICSGDTVTVGLPGASPCYNYSWIPATGLSSSTSFNARAYPTITTTYTITATTINCESHTDTFRVTVVDRPVAVITGDSSVCAGGASILSASSAFTYSWNTGATSNTINILPISNTTYSLVVTNGTCADSAVFTVSVMPLPFVDAGPSHIIAHGASVQLSAAASHSYLWFPATGLSCITCSSPIASPTVTTVYYVTTVDANGCTDMDSLTVTVDIACGDVFAPNVFSPNGDGENDVFYVYSNSSIYCLKEISLKIYNRWGELVFKTSDIGTGWDGIYKGELLNTDVFIYQLNILLFDKTEITRSGNITLMR